MPSPQFPSCPSCAMQKYQSGEKVFFFNHLVSSGDASSNDVGGLFNQGLLRKAVQKDYQEETGKQKDYQEEAAVSSKIWTDYNFSNDGCKI